MNSYSVPLLLLLVLSVITPLLGITSMSNTLTLHVRSDGEYVVFIDVLYPDGFKNIDRKLVRGEAFISLDISNVKDAWYDELVRRGRYAPLTLRLVFYNGDGLVDVKIIRVNYRELRFNNIFEINVLDRTRNEKSIKTVGYTTTRPIEPLVSAVRVLEDYYEENKTIVLAMLDVDDTSYGSLHYFYAASQQIGFAMYLIVPEIRLAGWVALARDASVAESVSTGIGGSAYVWMTFKYRWEKWRTYGPGLLPEGYMEEYIYVADFYPSTAGSGRTKPANAILVDVDVWESSVYQAGLEGEPYFSFLYGSLDTRYGSIDLTAFADTLLALGKISSSLWSSITTAISVIGVDSYINNVAAYTVSGDIYSTQPYSYHIVKTGKASVNVEGFNYFPVYYIVTFNW